VTSQIQAFAFLTARGVGVFSRSFSHGMIKGVCKDSELMMPIEVKFNYIFHIR
jgi:hypothetical protein